MLPISNLEYAKSFISDQFGFDKAYVKILKSYNGDVCYPLILNNSKNYIIFSVKDVVYQCLDGELNLIGKMR
jgi:hypothetical protein